jgi:hypothetical protein
MVCVVAEDILEVQVCLNGLTSLLRVSQGPSLHSSTCVQASGVLPCCQQLGEVVTQQHILLLLSCASLSHTIRRLVCVQPVCTHWVLLLWGQMPLSLVTLTAGLLVHSCALRALLLCSFVATGCSHSTYWCSLQHVKAVPAGCCPAVCASQLLLSMLLSCLQSGLPLSALTAAGMQV